MIKIVFMLCLFYLFVPVSPFCILSLQNVKKYRGAINVLFAVMAISLIFFTYKEESEKVVTSSFKISSFLEDGKFYFVGIENENGNKQVTRISKYHDIVRFSENCNQNSPKTLEIKKCEPTTKTYLLFDPFSHSVTKYNLY